jgi:hypothetical protein
MNLYSPAMQRMLDSLREIFGRFMSLIDEGGGPVGASEATGTAGGAVVINGVTELEAAEGSEVPTAFMATTVKVSVTSVVKPRT